MRSWLSLSFAALVACHSTPVAPVPRSVSPEWGFSGEDTRVDVFGDGLIPALDIAAGRPTGDDMNDAFDVLLQPVGDSSLTAATPLVGVAYQGLGHLSGVVPAGLPAGFYDVRVVTPAGAAGVGESLFTVRDTLVDRIALGVDAVTHEVYSEADVSIGLEDPSGAQVADDLEIDVTIEGADLTAADVVLRTAGLEHVIKLDAPAIGVRGTLGEDGVAHVFPLVKVPGEFTVRVASVDTNSRVTDDDVVLDWARGSDLSVRVDLPSDPFVATAGQAFTATLTLVDQFGLPAPDAVVSVAITDVCASWGSGLRVSGSATVQVRPTEATGTGRCANDRLVVVGAGVTGQSVDFEVQPGAHAGFSVLASPSQVTAGESLNAFVTPIDAWGNTTAWTGSITSVDDGGGVDSFSCQPGAVVVCSVRVLQAGLARALTLTDDGGNQGTSNVYSVSPAAPSVLAVTPDARRWEAGSASTIAFALTDEFDNAVTDASVDLSDLAVDDPQHEVSCVLGGQGLRCSLFTATDATSLSVSATVRLTPSGDVRLVGSTETLAVFNGPLASAVVMPDATRVRAGVPLGVSVTGLDAWGNPYLVRDNDALWLTDGTDALTPVGLTLGPDASGRADVVFSRAGRTAVLAGRGASVFGTSPPIDVDAADAVGLSVSLDTPWVFVGDAVTVRVEALDVYGNRARHDENIVVSSDSGLVSSAPLPMFNGLAVGDVQWSASSASDVVRVASGEGGGLSGASDVVPVLRHCAPSPTIDATVAGGSPVVCHDARGVASVSASFVGSTPTVGAAITLRGVREVGGAAVFGAAPVQVLEVTGDGLHTLRTLVAQDNGCGVEGTEVVWSGADDGSVVGPVVLSVAPDILDLDTTPTASVHVSGAVTCRGTPASGAALKLRSNRGELPGLVPTGAGLRVLLDGAGAGTVALDVSSDATGGVGEVVAWDQAAWGTASFEVLGDHLLPEVWTQDPKGPMTQPTDQIVVEFSEPMDPITVNSGAFEIQGTPELGVTALGLSNGGRVLTLSLDTTIGVTSNGWVLLLGDTFADLYGNRLAGGWDGVPRLYEGLFGVSDSSDPISACSVDHALFAPDGDDGSAEHADEVALSFSSASSPAWWVVSVQDDAGDVIRQHHVPPSARFGVWSWDGRDVDGAIVPDGTYTIRVRAEGARGGLGLPCARDVDVAQESGTP